MAKVFLSFTFLLFTLFAFGDRWFEPISEYEIDQTYAEVSSVFSISNPALLADFFQRVRAHGQWEAFSLPEKNGDLIDIKIRHIALMHADLNARYPEIFTFQGYVVSNPSEMVRLEYTVHGFSAALFSENGQVVYQPVKDDSNNFIVYYKQDAAPLRTYEFSCGITSDMEIDFSGFQGSSNRANASELLKYRLAVATTGEYTIFHGGTVEAGLAAVVVTVNRMDGIYTRDFGIAFELIPNNDTLIYTDPATDPYNNNNPGQMLGQNQQNLEAVIGFENYDIGHVLGTAGGGVAWFGVVCNHGSKARGMTGLPSPVGDPFDVDYVSHEVGHQFAAGHTFTFCSGGSPGQFLIEPGSGSTIMGYAGLCGGNNVQSFSDDYFHAATQNQIITFTSQGGAGSFCAEKIETENLPPEVDIISIEPFSIPTSTPFKLIASGSDPDGDEITYCWEQMDHGPAVPMNNPSGEAPLFRTRAPSTSPVRYFPQLQTVINGNFDVREQLPTYARTMTFRVTVRDNNPNVGAIAFQTISFTVDDNAGPFRVTFPTESQHVMFAGVPQNVAWDVANTDEIPTNCQSVNILLSLDGGLTYPHILAEDVPNIGTASVVLPNEYVTTARIKIQAADNIFYNISEANFSIEEYTSTSNVELPSMIIAPNPATKHVIISGYNDLNIELLTIYDIKGRMVSFLKNDNQEETILVDVSTLPGGLYLVKAVTNLGVICEKFVKSDF